MHFRAQGVLPWHGSEGVEVEAAVESLMSSVMDELETTACRCEDGWATLGLGGRELLAVEFFEDTGLFRCSLAQAFLYMILIGVKLTERK